MAADRGLTATGGGGVAEPTRALSHYHRRQIILEVTAGVRIRVSVPLCPLGEFYQHGGG